MNVYLDNAATTRTMDEVVDKIVMLLKDHYGNPSSLHYKGMEAEKELNEAKNIFSKLLKVEKKEIYFTSGGTESNNLAIFGVANAYHRSGKHLIVSSIEHPSVRKAFDHLKEEGYEITILPVDSMGLVDLEVLKQSIRPDTTLVSIMHVNNEIGCIQPIEKIGQLIKQCNPNTIFHVDAVQSFGKLWIQPKKALIDCLSISGHKIYAPKGIGALYIQSKVKIKPLFFGGSQQLGIRSGTENTSGIAGIAVASDFMYDHFDEISLRLKTLKLRLRNGIINEIERTYVNGPDLLLEEEKDICANHILNIRFEGIRGEVLLHALESKNIYISTGAACSSSKHEPSATLTAIGLNEAQTENSVRLSLSIYNTEEEIDYCIEQLKEMVPMLRKFTRK